MNKLISFFSALIICIFSVVIPTHAEDTPTILISSVTADSGDTVNVTLSLKHNPGIITMRLDLSYNKEVLTLTKVTDSGVFPGQNHSADYSAYPYSLYWENATATENIVVNDIITTLTFKIKDNAPSGSYPISVSYDLDNYDIFNYSLVPVEFITEPGNVSVSPKSDVNNYSISASDVLINKKFALTANLTTPNGYSDTLIVALYKEDNSFIDAELHAAAANVNIDMDTQGAAYAKLMWWDMETLSAYCSPLKIQIK